MCLTSGGMEREEPTRETGSGWVKLDHSQKCPVCSMNEWWGFPIGPTVCGNCSYSLSDKEKKAAKK